MMISTILYVSFLVLDWMALLYLVYVFDTSGGVGYVPFECWMYGKSSPEDALSVWIAVCGCAVVQTRGLLTWLKK